MYLRNPKYQSQPLLAYFGHHKCGTTWIRGIFEDLLSRYCWNNAQVTKPSDFDYDLLNYVNNEHVDFLNYTNADHKYVEKLKNYLGFHVVRDPRDVCVSAYYSHRNSHPIDNWPELAKHRNLLELLSKEDGLLKDMKFVKRYMEEIGSWNYSNPNILEIRFEELIENPQQSFKIILAFLGVNQRIPNKQKEQFNIIKDLEEVILKHSFINISGGRQRGNEDPKSHYRKGIAGDWKQHFAKIHRSYFKKHYNWVLLNSGYENNDSW